MRTICPKFRSSPGRDTIIVTEFVSKHGHPSLGGTNPSDASTELPHVGHCGEIFVSLIGRNKFMQQDGNHGPFVNQDTIRRKGLGFRFLLEAVRKYCLLVFLFSLYAFHPNPSLKDGWCPDTFWCCTLWALLYISWPCNGNQDVPTRPRTMGTTKIHLGQDGLGQKADKEKKKKKNNTFVLRPIRTHCWSWSIVFSSKQYPECPSEFTIGCITSFTCL